jgi:hypothetical protein
MHGLYRTNAAEMAEVMSSRPEVARLWRDELPERAHQTRKRVDKLTAAEVARMPEWAAKWTAIGLSTKRTDRPMFEAAVAACYRYSGLDHPKTIIWAPAPIVVAYTGSITTAWLRRHHASMNASVDASMNASVHYSVNDSVGDSVGDSVSASVRDSVSASVHYSVNASVSASVHDSVHDSVSDSVRASVDDSVSASVRASVGNSGRASVHYSVGNSVNARVHDSLHESVSASVHASVDASVDASVGNSVGASVGNSVGNSVHDSVNASVNVSVRDLEQWHLYNGGQFWVGRYWCGPASVSFALDVLRLDIGKEQELKARAYAAALSSACWWWPHRDFVVVSERPTLIDKHPNGRLLEARWEWRAENGKSCQWSVKP